MAYKIRTRRVAYDNVAVGSTAGRELHVAGSTATTDVETLAFENINAPSAPSTYRTTDALDHIITTTGGNTSVYTAETMINTN